MVYVLSYCLYISVNYQQFVWYLEICDILLISALLSFIPVNYQEIIWYLGMLGIICVHIFMLTTNGEFGMLKYVTYQ